MYVSCALGSKECIAILLATILESPPLSNEFTANVRIVCNPDLPTLIEVLGRLGFESTLSQFRVAAVVELVLARSEMLIDCCRW